MIADLDATVKRTKNFTVLISGLLAMDAEGDDDFDVFILDAGPVQFLDDDRQIDLAGGIAGDIRGDDHHLLSRSDNLFQRHGADRFTEGIFNDRSRIARGCLRQIDH